MYRALWPRNAKFWLGQTWYAWNSLCQDVYYLLHMLKRFDFALQSWQSIVVSLFRALSYINIIFYDIAKWAQSFKRVMSWIKITEGGWISAGRAGIITIGAVFNTNYSRCMYFDWNGRHNHTRWCLQHRFVIVV